MSQLLCWSKAPENGGDCVKQGSVPQSKKNIHAWTIDMDNGVGIAWGSGGAGWRGARGKNWDNYNSIINKYNLN